MRLRIVGGMAYPVRRGIPITAHFRQVSKVGNWKTCGHHTGTDWACQTGDPVYAVVDGDVRYRDYGPAFGLTVAVSPDGPGEWQYSHLSWRVPNGTRVKAGDVVGRAGTSGGVPPHLHLEWHPNHKNVWRCGIQADPVPEIQRLDQPGWRFGKGHKVYLSKLTFGGHESNDDGVSDSIVALQEMLNRHTLKGGQNLPLVGKYGPETDAEVIKCQTQCGFGADKPGTSFVGPGQAAHLVAATKAPYEVVDDRPKDGGGDKPSDEGEVRFLTANWPSRYTDGGAAADDALWAELAGQADVVGLQEAGWLVPRVKATPGWAVHCPNDSEGKRVGQVLAWRTALFDQVDVGATVISPPTRIQPEAAGPTTTREKHVVWADLRHKGTGRVWNVGVTHLVPSKHLGGAAGKLWNEQLAACAAWMGRQGDRCVLLGDFNCDKAHADAAPLKSVAVIRSDTSFGKRQIDWVAVKKGPATTSGAGRALSNRGQSDHKPVLVVVTDTGKGATPPPAGLRGIDIASYQAGIDLAKVDTDFVIVKATEGKTYTSPTFAGQYAAAKKAGKLLGIYHFARVNAPEDEADYFLRVIGDRVGEAVLVLDWEREPFGDVSWVKRWLDRVRERTGVRALVYMSEAVTHMADWGAVGAEHPLWVAKYRDTVPDRNYDMSGAGPEPRVAWPGGWVMWQWTASGLLDGWSKELDLNMSRLTVDDWARMAGPAGKEPPIDPKDKPVTRAEFEQMQGRVAAVEKAVAALTDELDRDVTALQEVVVKMAGEVTAALKVPEQVAVALRAASEVLEQNTPRQ